MDGDRFATFVSLLEIIALQHTRNGVSSRQPDQPGAAHFGHPPRIEFNDGRIRVEDFENLLPIGRGVFCNLFGRHRLARDIFAGRVADQSGEVANQENDRMTLLLKLAHFVQEHGVPEMQVGSGRVKSDLDPQFPAISQSLDQLLAQQNLFRAAAQFGEVFIVLLVHGSLSVPVLCILVRDILRDLKRKIFFDLAGISL